MTPREAAEKAYKDYRAESRRSGRNPIWPYVAVVRYRMADRTGRPQTFTCKGFAFKSIPEAKAHAQKQINHMIDELERRLKQPHMRALRRQHGVTEA